MGAAGVRIWSGDGDATPPACGCGAGAEEAASGAIEEERVGSVGRGGVPMVSREE